MDEPTVEVGRLVMLDEGDFWNAYYATDPEKERVLIGCIRMNAVVNNPQRTDAFMLMMADVVSDFIAKSTGHRPAWSGPYPAPENEQSGHG